MKTLLRKLRGTPPEPASNCKNINLGLQGGGAHGAFTWGVLDYLLEDRRSTSRAFPARRPAR